MSTLSSASTDAEVLASYDDNASYDEDASVTKARAFVTACRIMMSRLPKMTGRNGVQIQIGIEEVRMQQARAETWLAANDTGRGARVVHLEPGGRQ